jgi:diguanylate cyclase
MAPFTRGLFSFAPAPAPSAPPARATASPEAACSPEAGANAGQDPGLDAIARALRVLESRPLPTGAASPWDAAEAWARHVALGAPAPGCQQAPGDGRREWMGLSAFLVAARQTEQSQVGRVIGDLRGSLSACVEAFRASCAADGEADAGVGLELERLVQLVQREPPSALKAQIGRLVDTIGRTVEGRRRRQEAELRTLAARLDAARGALLEAQRESQTDALTQLANRRAFDAFVLRALRLRDEFQQVSTLVLFDADHFKRINDDFGHPTGDVVLRRIADTLVRSFPRRSDFVGRYGGEEFAVILADVPAPAARQLVERSLTSVRDQRIEHQGAVLRVTLSAGIAELRTGESVEGWLGRTDAALLRAKQTGRDRSVVAA